MKIEELQSTDNTQNDENGETEEGLVLHSRYQRRPIPISAILSNQMRIQHNSEHSPSLAADPRSFMMRSYRDALLSHPSNRGIIRQTGESTDEENNNSNNNTNNNNNYYNNNFSHSQSLQQQQQQQNSEYETIEGNGVSGTMRGYRVIANPQIRHTPNFIQLRSFHSDNDENGDDGENDTETVRVITYPTQRFIRSMNDRSRLSSNTLTPASNASSSSLSSSASSYPQHSSSASSGSNQQQPITYMVRHINTNFGPSNYIPIAVQHHSFPIQTISYESDGSDSDGGDDDEDEA